MTSQELEMLLKEIIEPMLGDISTLKKTFAETLRVAEDEKLSSVQTRSMIVERFSEERERLLRDRDSFRGLRGKTGIAGVKGDRGDTGVPGRDGTSITVDEVVSKLRVDTVLRNEIQRVSEASVGASVDSAMFDFRENELKEVELILGV